MLDKAMLRKKYKSIRDGLNEAWRMNMSEKICAHICGMSEYRDARSILLYSAIRSEASLDALISRALSDGKTVLLPVCDPKTETMHASEMRDMSELVCGAYSIAEPTDKRIFDARQIDIVLVPGLVFAESGYRIGYGKGYYDKFLAKNPSVFKLGAAFSCQLCNEVFEAEHDIRLDAIATEKGVISCEGA